MPPAVIPAAVAAVGTIGGAILGSSAQKSAANKAVQVQNQATNAQLQLGRESMGLNRDIYNSNYQTLSPFVSNGLVASNAMNALLGLPAAPPPTSPLAQPPGAATGGIVTNSLHTPGLPSAQSGAQLGTQAQPGAQAMGGTPISQLFNR